MTGSWVIAGVVLLLLLFLTSVLAAVAWLRARRRQTELEKALRQAGASTEERAPARVGRSVVESIAHELRSPMTGIMGHQELLEEGLYGDMDERCHQAVVRIGEGARELLDLLDGTLDLARIDGGSLELQKDVVNGAEIASEVVEFAKRLSAERATGLEARTQEDLPRLESDRARLVRTIHLAVTAAIRSAPGGDLRLRVESDEDVAIRITVSGTELSADALRGDAGSDAGPHADDVQAARAELRAALAAARPAQEADPSATGSGDPRALGSSWLRLTIARTLARRLGGDLRIETASEGTRLALRIPAKRAVASEEAENAGEGPGGRR